MVGHQLISGHLRGFLGLGITYQGHLLNTPPFLRIRQHMVKIPHTSQWWSFIHTLRYTCRLDLTVPRYQCLATLSLLNRSSCVHTSILESSPSISSYATDVNIFAASRSRLYSLSIRTQVPYLIGTELLFTQASPHRSTQASTIDMYLGADGSGSAI